MTIKTALRLAVLGTCSAAGLAAPTHAQDTAQGLPQGPRVEDIVVTAQKRSESALKVSASLVAIAGGDLKTKGVTSARNLDDQIANFAVGSAYDGAIDINIRGITTSDNTNKGDPAAAFTIDGIYIGRPQASGSTFIDIDRIEVLRGPQGTLYGRNANAGAVNVISNKPTDKSELVVHADYGNFNAVNADAMVNLPVTDALSVRGVLAYARHDGYAQSTNPANGAIRKEDDLDNLSGRLLASWRISDATKLLVGFDASHDGGTGAALYLLKNGAIPGNRTKLAEIQGRRSRQNLGTFLQFDTDLHFARLTYLAGYRRFTTNDVLDLGEAPGLWGPSQSSTWQQSHELRLSGGTSADRLQWVAGLYYYYENGSYTSFDIRLPIEIGGGRAIHYVQGPSISRSLAAFGQITYALWDGTRLIAGLRGTKDHKSRVGEERFGANDTPNPALADQAERSWGQVTWKLGLEHDVARSVMAYATVSTGFKAGGFNDQNINVNPNLYYNPEKIIAYEAGLKGRYFDGRLQSTVDAFYYDYSNLQKSTASNNSIVTTNAAKAKVYGAEADAQVALWQGGRLNLALGLLSATYGQYLAPNGQSLAGQRLDQAPSVTLTAGYTQTWRMGGGASVSLYGGTKYTGAYTLSDTGSLTLAPRSFTQGATTKSQLVLTYAAAGDRWSLQAFAKNLENTIAPSSLIQNGGAYYMTLQEPRLFGLRVSYRM